MSSHEPNSGQEDPFASQHPELDWQDMGERAEAGYRGDISDTAQEIKASIDPILQRIEVERRISELPQRVDDLGNEGVQIGQKWYSKERIIPAILAGEFKLPEPKLEDDEVQSAVDTYFEKMKENRPPTIVSFDVNEYYKKWSDQSIKVGKFYPSGFRDNPEYIAAKEKYDEYKNALDGLEQPEVALIGNTKYPIVIYEWIQENTEELNTYGKRTINWLGCTNRERAEAYVEQLGGEDFKLRLPGTREAYDYTHEHVVRVKTEDKNIRFIRKVFENPHYKSDTAE